MADGDKTANGKHGEGAKGTKWTPTSFEWSYGAPINGFVNGQLGLQPYFWNLLPPFVTGRGPPRTNHFG